jgi:hypothetical protein
MPRTRVLQHTPLRYSSRSHCVLSIYIDALDLKRGNAYRCAPINSERSGPACLAATGTYR